VPTFLDIGNIAIIASSEINAISKGNAALVAANTALIASGSNITLYCSTLTDIQSPIISFSTPQFNVGASNTNFSGTADFKKSLTASTINTRYASISSIVNVSSINGAAYSSAASIPSDLTVSSISAKAITNLSSINGVAYTNGSATVTSTFTTLFTSTISGNPLNYLSLVANRNITKTALSSITLCPASYFSGDVRVSSLNGAAVGGGGGGSWVGTATTNLNMGTYDINGSALIINSSNAGDFTIQTQAGHGAILNLIADSYVYSESRTSEIYFNAATNIGGYGGGNIDFQGNYYRGTSYTGMYFTNYGAGGYGMTFQSSDRIIMYSDYQWTVTCSNQPINLRAKGGVEITDRNTGGTGFLTVSAANQLYWRGILIA
jgi:hypothetical protein